MVLSRNWMGLGLIVGALGAVSPLAFGADVVVKSSSLSEVSQTDGANYTITVDTSYPVLLGGFKKNVLAALRRLPLLTRINSFVEAPLTATSDSVDQRTVAGEHILLARFSDDRLLPESLFAFTESRVECKAKPDCYMRTELEVTGPIKSYGEKLDIRKPQDLNGTFAFTAALSPVDAKDLTKGSKIVLDLKFNDMRYLHYFASLVEKKHLRSLPKNEEINTGFLLWAKTAAPDLAKGGAQ